uniref:Uncharacterized protein n=1 Tax=Rhizophora mucronata TaxID=61149 RepID=A0A2P2NZ38_RHIMU
MFPWRIRHSLSCASFCIIRFHSSAVLQRTELHDPGCLSSQISWL